MSLGAIYPTWNECCEHSTSFRLSQLSHTSACEGGDSLLASLLPQYPSWLFSLALEKVCFVSALDDAEDFILGILPIRESNIKRCTLACDWRRCFWIYKKLERHRKNRTQHITLVYSRSVSRNVAHIFMIWNICIPWAASAGDWSTQKCYEHGEIQGMDILLLSFKMRKGSAPASQSTSTKSEFPFLHSHIESEHK